MDGKREGDPMTRRERQSRRRRGITLIEMLVVLTIIALFAALVAPRV
jgi:prepilin-type N-terminal cleavage/methylation domain-containing protein